MPNDKSETTATQPQDQEPRVKLSAHALNRLYSGAPGTSADDIMHASGALSRQDFLGPFFKKSAEDATTGATTLPNV